MIAPFDIFYQQEVSCIYNYFPKTQQVMCDSGTRKSYYFGQWQSITIFSIQCNLTLIYIRCMIKSIN